MPEIVEALIEVEPEYIIAECGECGMRLYDSETHAVVGGYLNEANYIESSARKHADKTGHYDLDVVLEKSKPVDDIDVTITVNE